MKKQLTPLYNKNMETAQKVQNPFLKEIIMSNSTPKILTLADILNGMGVDPRDRNKNPYTVVEDLLDLVFEDDDFPLEEVFETLAEQHAYFLEATEPGDKESNQAWRTQALGNALKFIKTQLDGNTFFRA